ncbi:MAG: deoxyguanosinetriphosphate triphosphohydrolase [Clostridiales bacterium]|nr:deoxyguanosinetriphosphate triphosphohydrolase [Clostridiales bacterium]
MNNRESIEKREYEFLSPLACKAAESKGRVYEEEQCEYRTDFQRDRDRIVHSKAFRRLIHKTQVFLAPEGDHYRTRLTHTLEVSQIARTVARILAYNEDLTEAIALGHDLGHTPFGHVGEKVLNNIHPGGFEHNVQSLRTVDVIEDTSKRRGLNLTYEVRDGILNHRGPVTPMTLEGQIVKICDRIAYVNHDIDDAIRSGVITFEDLPQREIEIIGSTHSERINNLIVDLCSNSEGKDVVSLSPVFADSLDRLRSYLFENVYNSTEVRGVSALDKVERIINSLYRYYMEHSDEIPGVYKLIEEEEGTAVAVKDLVSGMTDRYALNLYDKLFVPQGWRQL